MSTQPPQSSPLRGLRASAVNPNPHSPRWSWTLLKAAEFWLDGGAMFGIIPRPVWLKWFPQSGPNAVDDHHRIPLQTNCLLLESEGGPGAQSKQLVLIEVGIGDKFPPKERALYRQQDRAVHDALHDINCNPSDINHVICTHLHFDHAGGLTKRASPNAGPDDAPQLVFPNARIISQRQEWDDALANRSTMHKTYLRNHLTPEIAERMTLIEGEKEALPGITVFPVPGHTWGQQAVRFTDTTNRTIVFVPDVMPTALHARPTTNMAYDVESYTSMQQRLALLERAAKDNWTLVLDHEHGHPVFTVGTDHDSQHRLLPAGFA